jgi:hypothetical protein
MLGGRQQMRTSFDHQRAYRLAMAGDLTLLVNQKPTRRAISPGGRMNVGASWPRSIPHRQPLNFVTVVISAVREIKLAFYLSLETVT